MTEKLRVTQAAYQYFYSSPLVILCDVAVYQALLHKRSNITCIILVSSGGLLYLPDENLEGLQESKLLELVGFPIGLKAFFARGDLNPIAQALSTFGEVQKMFNPHKTFFIEENCPPHTIQAMFDDLIFSCFGSLQSRMAVKDRQLSAMRQQSEDLFAQLEHYQNMLEVAKIHPQILLFEASKTEQFFAPKPEQPQAYKFTLPCQLDIISYVMVYCRTARTGDGNPLADGHFYIKITDQRQENFESIHKFSYADIKHEPLLISLNDIGGGSIGDACIEFEWFTMRSGAVPAVYLSDIDTTDYWPKLPAIRLYGGLEAKSLKSDIFLNAKDE